MTGGVEVLALPTAEVPPDVLEDIHRLMLAAFEGDLTDEDWAHTVGGVHFIVEERGSVAAHASAVPRALEVAGRPFRAGYVEGVATDPAKQRRGLGSAVMSAASEHIRSHFEMGALGTDLFSFYERFGWARWKGPTYVRRDNGELSRSKDEDGFVMVLCFGPSADLDLSAPISCEERPGDNW